MIPITLAEIVKYNTHRWLWVAAFVSMGISLTGFYLESIPLACAPLLLAGACLAVYQFSILYYFMLAAIPVCMEISFGSLSSDIPAEPLMLSLLGACVLYYLGETKRELSYFKHPFVQFILFQFVWYVVVFIYSSVPLISLKYVLAKTWYIAAFVVATFIIITDVKKFKLAFWCVFYPLLFTILWTMIKHWQQGFSFEASNHVPEPFYHNHVDYACIVSIMLPLLFVASSWYKPGDLKWILLQASKVLFLVAIFFSYTRTCWLAVGVALAAYYIFKWKLIKPVLVVGIIGLALIVAYLSFENRYLSYAPDYKKTIYHHNLSDHLESTQTLNDVSSAERLYRWVAAAEMIKEKPITGFGQGGFVANYRNYAVSLFTTYVSHNFEHSTVHNYLLFIMVEQGLPGLLLFLGFIIYVLIAGQRIYIQTKDTTEKNIVLGILVAFVVILFDNMLSDLIEAVKIGPFYYFFIALLVIQDVKNRKEIALPVPL
jgi:O-antigen ligase